MTVTCFFRHPIVRRDAAEMAACERYRATRERDAEARADLDHAPSRRFLLREERTCLEDVSTTRDVARQVTP